MFRVIFIGVLVMSQLTLTACPDADDVQIKAVSVDPSTNHIVISWTSNLSPYAYGYEFFETPGVGPADAVFDAGQTSFVLQREADTNLQIRIRAINRCDDGTIRPGRISENRRVFSSRIEQWNCARDIRIYWGNASQSIRDIAHFEIFVSIDGGTFDSVATADASQNFTTISTIGHHGQSLRIFVRAVSSDPTIYANSMADTLTLHLAPTPNFANLETVSVVNNTTVEIRTSVDVSEPWGNIYFFADNALLRTASYSDFLQNDGRFSLPRIEHAFYHFKISDTCGIVVRYSDTVAKPIRLVGNLDARTVTFSEYYGWFGSTIRYDLFEIRDGDTTQYTWRLPNLPHEFTLAETELVMNLSYFVVAYKISPTGEQIDSTRSNVISLISRTEIPVYFADAFMPSSTIPANQRFRPFFISMPNDQMRFSIFNTFGQVVFTTTDPYHIGWDGTFNNRDAQPGTYTYHFELTRGNTTTRKRGVVVLIR